MDKIINFQKKINDFMTQEENDEKDEGQLSNNILIEDKPLKLGYSFLLNNKEILFLSVKDLMELRSNKDKYVKFYFNKDVLYFDLWKYFEDKNIDKNDKKIKKEIIFDNLMSYAF